MWGDDDDVSKEKDSEREYIINGLETWQILYEQHPGESTLSVTKLKGNLFTLVAVQVLFMGIGIMKKLSAT